MTISGMAPFSLKGKSRIVEPLGLETDRLDPDLVLSDGFYGNYPDVLWPKRPFQDIAWLDLHRLIPRKRLNKKPHSIEKMGFILGTAHKNLPFFLSSQDNSDG